MIRDLPILDVLRTKMRWHEARQRVLAENVANADTPGYRGKDLITPRFGEPRAVVAPQGLTVAATAPGHIAGVAPSSERAGFRLERKPDFETTPNGNQVTLEDEMTKVSENQLDYQAVASLYQRGLGVLRTAIGRRA